MQINDEFNIFEGVTKVKSNIFILSEEKTLGLYTQTTFRKTFSVAKSKTSKSKSFWTWHFVYILIAPAF